MACNGGIIRVFRRTTSRTKRGRGLRRRRRGIIKTIFWCALGLLVAVGGALLAFSESDSIEIPEEFTGSSDLYFGERRPGSTPTVFAPSILGDDLHTPPIYAPDGESVYWCQMDSAGTDEILWMRRVDGVWQPPEVIPFASRFFESDSPCLSPDGERIFFTSFRPTSLGRLFAGQETIWYSERTSSGWGSVKPVPFAGDPPSAHWSLSITEDGTLYFGFGGEILVATPTAGVYGAPQPIGPPIGSSGRDEMPYVAPDGSYMLFGSDGHASHLGNTDLYLSIRQPDSTWGRPIHLDSPVSSIHQDLCPTVSPDGEYLFFLSTRRGNHRAFWVDASVVTDLLP